MNKLTAATYSLNKPERKFIFTLDRVDIKVYEKSNWNYNVDAATMHSHKSTLGDVKKYKIKVDECSRVTKTSLKNK